MVHGPLVSAPPRYSPCSKFSTAVHGLENVWTDRGEGLEYPRFEHTREATSLFENASCALQNVRSRLRQPHKKKPD